MAKPKNKNIPWPILGIIYACLLFAMYVSLSTLVLGFWGQTTVGTTDSYESRLDNRNAGENRSRTVSKGYHFTVNGKSYRGYVIYLSDESWPRLSKGETRAERISYLAIFPYINKPSDLVEFDEMGALAIAYHSLAPFGYLFLLFLVAGTVKNQKKKAQRMSNRNVKNHTATQKTTEITCSACGSKMPSDAQFCAECGALMKRPATNNCSSCGQALPDNAGFCPHCGVKSPSVEADAASPAPHAQTTPTVGFSSYCNHPEILEAARKNRKSSIGCMWALTLVPLIGFMAAGLLIDEFPFGEAVVIGVGVALLMFIANVVALRRAKKPMWEGVVVDKSSKKRSKRESKDDSTYTTYTEYTTVISTKGGKKKTIVEVDSRRDMYDYLSVGDRVRYHPAFGTYEKYDKSKDRIIFCNVCSMQSPIHNDRCKRCNNLLFK